MRSQKRVLLLFKVCINKGSSKKSTVRATFCESPRPSPGHLARRPRSFVHAAVTAAAALGRRLRRPRRRTSPPSWLVGALRRLRALVNRESNRRQLPCSPTHTHTLATVSASEAWQAASGLESGEISDMSLRAAFKRIDLNGNGVIEQHELKAALLASGYFRWRATRRRGRRWTT